MYEKSDITRRNLLKSGVATSLSSILPTMALMANAEAAQSDDYKALVCVFLGGGEDSHNSVLATDPETWKNYASARPVIALDQSRLLPIADKNSARLNSGRQFALHPALTFHKQMWDAGHLAVVPNVGTLLEPTSLQQIRAGTARLPRALMAHNHQINHWLCLAPKVRAEGWGARLADYFDNGLYATLSSMRIDGSGWSHSKRTKPFDLVEDMNIKLSPLVDNYLNSSQVQILREMMFADSDSPFVKDWQTIMKDAIDLNNIMNEKARSFNVKAANGYEKKFRILLQGISAGKSIGLKRQVFFMQGPGKYDTHGDVVEALQGLHSTMSAGLAYFHEQLKLYGLLDQVTLFTASEFGRTLKSNSSGSDHGWGGHHYVFGGAVKGGEMYGRFPDVGLGTRDDLVNGALIPSISVEQYGATLGKWMGLSDAQLLEVFPNLANFGGKNLGFMAA